MKWETPPIIKVHEALGCIADGRIEKEGLEAKVYSSSRGKFYTVKYSPQDNAIMCNDNGSYYVGYLGYPAVAFLMLHGVVDYNPEFADAFKDIKWKDINQKFQNDFVKTESHVMQLAAQRGYNRQELEEEIKRIYSHIRRLEINLLGEKTLPPKAY